MIYITFFIVILIDKRGVRETILQTILQTILDTILDTIHIPIQKNYKAVKRELERARQRETERKEASATPPPSAHPARHSTITQHECTRERKRGMTPHRHHTDTAAPTTAAHRL